MRTHLLRAAMIAAAILTTLAAAASEAPVNPADNFVLVQGGTFKDTKSNYYEKGVTVSSFYIAKYDVTQKEWVDVMGSNPSKFTGDNLPVEMVSWYDAVEYCNRRSIKEGLQPYYRIDKKTKDMNNKPDPNYGDLDDIKWTVTINPTANGYRLPTEAVSSPRRWSSRESISVGNGLRRRCSVRVPLGG